MLESQTLTGVNENKTRPQAVVTLSSEPSAGGKKIKLSQLGVERIE